MKFFLNALVVIGFSLAATFAAADAKSEKYTVGVIIPLSGQVASLGGFVKRGIDLAYEGLPESTRKRVQLIYEDDQFDPVKTVSAYRKLNSTVGLDAVFVAGSSTANALGPIIERDRKIMIAIGASDPTIAVGKEFSFIHWVIPPVLGKALAEEIKKKDFKRIGFVVGEASGSVADTEAAIQALKDLNLGDRIVYHGTFAKSETDYRSVVAQLRQKQVDAVVACLFPGALSSFAKQFKAGKINAELIGMETFEDQGEVKAAEGALEGAWYVNASDSTSSFVDSHMKHYGEHPGWGSGNGYDAMQLISDAVVSVGTDNQKIRDFLRSVKDHQGATGVFSASGDNRFTLPASLKKIVAGEFLPLH